MIDPTARSFTVSPWAMTVFRMMLPALSISISAACPRAEAVRARLARLASLKKMPPVVEAAVIADTLVSILLPDVPIMAPFRLALSALTLVLAPFPSINAPKAVKLTSWPVAVTGPSVRSPEAEMDTTPPVATAEVSASVLLLASNSPPPAPPSAVRVLTELSSPSPPEPMPFVASRLSVSADTLLSTPFPSRIAPLVWSVTWPGEETSPTVMLPVALRTLMLPAVADALTVNALASSIKTPPVSVVAISVATSVSILLKELPMPVFAVSFVEPPRRSTAVSLMSSTIAPAAVMLISLLPASTRPSLTSPVLVSNVTAAPAAFSTRVLATNERDPPRKLIATSPALVLAATELSATRPPFLLSIKIAAAGVMPAAAVLTVARKSEVFVSSGSRSVPMPDVPLRLTIGPVMFTAAPLSSNSDPPLFSTVTAPCAVIVWMRRFVPVLVSNTWLPTPPATTDTAVLATNCARKIGPLVVLALKVSTVDSMASLSWPTVPAPTRFTLRARTLFDA